MKGQKWREIVIEVERTQIVRKKTQTHLMFCRNCGREVDSESLPEAAALFTANAENLLKFVRVSRSHFETGADGEIYLCFVSFLASMKAKTNASQTKSPVEFDVLCRNTRSKSLQVL